MKKLFLFSIVLLSQAAIAQQQVWSNSFDTPADLQGWTLHDVNNNGNGWVQGQNIYFNGTNALTYGTAGVLRYSISLVPTGNATGFASENDWIISPQISLEGASGTINLAAYIGRQRTTHFNIGRDLFIYVSTPEKPVPALADFQAMTVDANGNDIPSQYSVIAGTVDNPFPNDLTQFQEDIIDISAFAGKKIYIGMWSNRKSGGNNLQNINIDEMAIYASTFLGTKDVKKKENLTKIEENPVKEFLQLKLNPNFKENKTAVTIYNAAGQKILSAQYNRAVNVASLQAGLYMAEVSDGNTTETLKFIKK
ncbi:T9SS type A sorting domain-containing protein [Chryseobacterium sp. L7]|uniref:T9SS type A sorting domain-containing protein n=1 Tax=Chryseobacterium endalhagicum TaxID=2797638 RepID=A0ABS1QIT0_9FLAO|nr:T9SS type A sorting domain-containing protein [Chryseobacterium endalhagicum]MBL1222503.1 T9SS type A sorting domain-containing protein [Chryseobacterium endalhagicum]